MMVKVLYDEKMSRYEYRLTEKGMDLYPVLMTVVQWGDKWVSDKDGPPIEFEHIPCGHVSSPHYACEHCAHEIQAKDMKPVLGPGVEKKLARGELSSDDPEHLHDIVY